VTPFLITGQPRSRTFWMARAASTRQSICHHEPMAMLTRWEGVFRTIWHQHHMVPFIGISDHGLGFHLPAIIERVAPRILIIERPLDDVKASLAKLGLAATNFCDLLAEYLAYEHPLIQRVGYGELADTDVVVEALRYLMPGLRVDRARIDRLQTVNLQADFLVTMRHAARAADDLESFLPAEVLARLAAT
jgi:hypothetical protein